MRRHEHQWVIHSHPVTRFTVYLDFWWFSHVLPLLIVIMSSTKSLYDWLDVQTHYRTYFLTLWSAVCGHFLMIAVAIIKGVGFGEIIMFHVDAAKSVSDAWSYFACVCFCHSTFTKLCYLSFFLLGRRYSFLSQPYFLGSKEDWMIFLVVLVCDDKVMISAVGCVRVL